MKLYRISQDKNDGYDTYDSAVVAAENENEAKLIHPSSFVVSLWTEGGWMGAYCNENRPEIHGRPYVAEDPNGGCSWSHPDNVTVEYLGEAKAGTGRGVIVASFNAG